MFTHPHTNTDLGIGVKVAGGVKCEKCGNLHTVITDVQGNSAPQLYKGRIILYEV